MTSMARWKQIFGNMFRNHRSVLLALLVTLCVMYMVSLHWDTHNQATDKVLAQQNIQSKQEHELQINNVKQDDSNNPALKLSQTDDQINVKEPENKDGSVIGDKNKHQSYQSKKAQKTVHDIAIQTQNKQATKSVKFVQNSGSNMRSLNTIPNFNSPLQMKDPDLVHITGIESQVFDGDGTQFLRNDLAPGSVHYVWCGKRWFQFHHYLSFLSVIKLIQPDKITLHYEYKPEVDYKKYNLWLWDLTNDYPFLVFKQLPEDKNQSICNSERNKFNFIYGLLRENGGIYIDEHTIMTEFAFKFRQYDLFSAMMKQGGLLIAKPNVLTGQSINSIFMDDKYKAGHAPCATYNDFIANSFRYSCVVMTRSFYPKDIWNLKNSFGRITRKLLYNTEILPVPRATYDTLVPNIAHMVWMGGGQMDFLFYLSVLSVLNILKAETLYIHGDKPPTGHYWERVKNNNRIVLVHRDRPETIYQNEVKTPQHISDIVRVDIMVKYGGIYCDVDMIWVNPLNPVLRGYDAVASYDWVDWDPPYPNIINFGVTLGKRGAPFWHLFQKSMQYFRKKSWGFNGLRQPYRVYEKFPGLLKIEEHLQVICFNFKCHPTWIPHYQNESINHLNTPLDWRKDTFSFHWTAPVPRELRSQTALMQSHGMFAEIGKFVLKESGIIK